MLQYVWLALATWTALVLTGIWGALTSIAEEMRWDLDKEDDDDGD